MHRKIGADILGPLAQCQLNSENADLGNKQNVRLPSSLFFLFCFLEVHSVSDANWN